MSTGSGCVRVLNCVQSIGITLFDFKSNDEAELYRVGYLDDCVES